MRLKHVDKVVRCVSCVFPALGMSTGAHRGSAWCPGETSEPGEKTPLSAEHRWAPTAAALLHTLSAAMTHCIQTCPYISSEVLTRMGSFLSDPFIRKVKNLKRAGNSSGVWFRTGAGCSFAGKKTFHSTFLSLLCPALTPSGYFLRLRYLCGSQWNSFFPLCVNVL